MVAQIVTKQKTVLPPGVVSLQNMEVVCLGITQRLKRRDAA
jgi:hypothetical protein